MAGSDEKVESCKGDNGQFACDIYHYIAMLEAPNSWIALSFRDKGKDHVEHDSLVCSSCHLSKIVAYILNDYISTKGVRIFYECGVNGTKIMHHLACSYILGYYA